MLRLGSCIQEQNDRPPEEGAFWICCGAGPQGPLALPMPRGGLSVLRRGGWRRSGLPPHPPTYSLKRGHLPVPHLGLRPVLGLLAP